jgi:hypothetical protein
VHKGDVLLGIYKSDFSMKIGFLGRMSVKLQYRSKTVGAIETVLPDWSPGPVMTMALPLDLPLAIVSFNASGHLTN